MHVIPLDHPYLLVLPNVKPYTKLSIHTFAPSAPTGSSSLVCTLQLPELHPTQHISWHDICTSRRPPPLARSGHFRADPAHWMIAFALYTGLGRHRFTSHLLIPRATLSAQIRAAEARQQLAIETARGGGGGEAEASVPVPWQDWGARGCLRLRLLRTPFSGILRLVPFGSRMPFVVFDPPTVQSGSVYVFDLNPLAARNARQFLSSPNPSRGDGSSDGGLVGAGVGAIVEDVDAALAGVVDPGCSAIPYVVYRFDVPERLEIRSVVMSMTGFMVLVSIRVRPHLVFLCVLVRCLTRLARVFRAMIPRLRRRCKPGRCDAGSGWCWGRLGFMLNATRAHPVDRVSRTWILAFKTTSTGRRNTVLVSQHACDSPTELTATPGRQSRC